MESIFKLILADCQGWPEKQTPWPVLAGLRVSLSSYKLLPYPRLAFLRVPQILSDYWERDGETG